ncbi:MAG: DNA-binding protein [Erysipelotrichaceae bacterium]|nr:DNA-binding protein [Erysipelotrichaceae bacterium]
MKEFAIRLKRGTDLKKAIENIAQENNFDTIVVLSAVGCVSRAHFRLAKAIEDIDVEDGFEILSLNGTVSKGKAHLHICFSDEFGNAFGGHLKEGTIIETTCELVLGILEEYSSQRSYDEETGYDEIEFKKEGKKYD